MRIVVGFSTTNLLISRIIRYFTNSDISHCYIRIYDEFLKTSLVIHADMPGVVFQHSDEFDKANTVIEEFAIDDDLSLFVSLQKHLRFLGRKYDYLALFGWAWTIAFHRWLKTKLKNPCDDPKKLICAELVARIFQDAGYKINNSTPSILRQWFRDNYSKYGWVRIVNAPK